MENFIQLNKPGLNNQGTIDVEAFLTARLDSVRAKIKAQLSSFDQRAWTFDAAFYEERVSATLRKMKEAYAVLEKLDLDLQQRVDHALDILEERYDSLTYSLPHINAKSLPFLERLDAAVHILEQKYEELECANLDRFERAVDGAIDATMRKIEEVDERISEAVESANMQYGAIKKGVNDKILQAAETAHTHVDAIKEAAIEGAKRLLKYDELPEDWQHNQHIHTGYRFLPTPAACFHSIFYLHNETGNIYTHLIGFVFFLGLGLKEHFGSTFLHGLPVVDRVIFGLFFLAACKCLVCSTIWHTFAGIGDIHTFKRFACLDYVGISVLICASVVVVEYYGFYYEPVFRNTYLTGTAVMTVMGVVMPFSSWFEQKETKWLRITFFISLAASGVIPVLHLFVTRGFFKTFAWLSPILYSLASYLIGVFVYGNQYPESLFPGYFDHIGHSHQLWHLFVCGGIWFHYSACLGFATDRESFSA